MRQFLPLMTIALAALFATSVTAQFKPTQPAQGFNVFVRNELTAKGGDTHGPVAMGGNFILNGNTIFTMNTTGTYPTGVLNDDNNYGIVIGGQVNYTSGNQTQVNKGYLRIGNTTGTTIWYTDNNNAATNLKLTSSAGGFSSNPSVILQRQQAVGTATDPHGLNFTAAFGSLSSTASKIDSWKSSSSSLLNKITIPNSSNPHITLVNNRINYINLTAAELDNLNSQGSIIFDNAPALSRPLVINVKVSGTYNWTPPNIGGLSESDGDFILWNFFTTTELNLNGSNNIYGTIFSPLAAITKNNANNLNGQVVGSSLVIVTGEIHYHPFITDRPDIPAESPLGIRQIDVKGTLANQIVQLDWTVLQEENMLAYDVERSIDGINFSTTGTLPSRGNSVRSAYVFQDMITAVNAPVLYYRIRAKENNGAVYYSAVVVIRNRSTAATVDAWPNPFVDKVMVSVNSSIDQRIQLQLFDTRGVRIRQSASTLVRGRNQLQLDGLSNQQPGIYLLRIIAADGSLLANQPLLK